MVMLSSEFWREHVASVPFGRRLLLLPHCLKHSEGCRAEYDELGLACEQCGLCCIGDFRSRAEQLGYQVLVAEGSPIVMKTIIEGQVDAIVGVSCLNVLEKAFDKVLRAGVPCMAVPLLSSNCKDSTVDEDWVSEMIELRREESTLQTESYVPLLRAARSLFDPAELNRLLDDSSEAGATAAAEDDAPDGLDPLTATETMARRFLARGGKYARPFITLAAYDAFAGEAAGGCRR